MRLFVWRLGDDATGVLADNVGWMAWNLLLAVIPAVLAVAHTDLVLTVPRTLAQMTKRIVSLRMIEAPRELKPFP